MTNTTTFAAGTVIRHEWLNDVNRKTFGEYIDVRAFGATCDGVIDDTVFVQEALNSGYDNVYIPGFCRTTATLIRPPRVRVFGDNPYTSGFIAAHNGVIMQTTPTTLDGDTHAGIHRLGFKNASGFTSTIGISLANLNQTYLKEVRVEEGPIIGIQLVFVLNSVFEQVSLITCTGVGLYAYSNSLAVGNNRNTYKEININYCAKGIRLDTSGTLQSHFSDVAIENSTVYPLEVLSGSKIIFDTLYLEANTTSVQLSGGDDIIFNDVMNVSVQQFINTTGFAATRVQVNDLFDLSGGGIISNANVTVRQFGQIKFPSTPVLSTDPNTLDDYKEGTWTPGDASGAGLTFTSVSGSFTKKGREVTARFKLTFPVTANGANATIGGLPYQADDQYAVAISHCTETTLVRGETFTGQSYVQFTTSAGATITNATLSGDTVRGTITYFV